MEEQTFLERVAYHIGDARYTAMEWGEWMTRHPYTCIGVLLGLAVVVGYYGLVQSSRETDSM